MPKKQLSEHDMLTAHWTRQYLGQWSDNH